MQKFVISIFINSLWSSTSCWKFFYNRLHTHTRISKQSASCSLDIHLPPTFGKVKSMTTMVTGLRCRNLTKSKQ